MKIENYSLSSFNQKIASAFSEIADLLELQDSNPFRVRAYRRASAIVQNLPRDASKYSFAELDAISGIGKELAEKIQEFVRTSRIRFLIRERKKFPTGLLRMLAIPGLGPKTAKLFYKNLKIKNIAELKRAAKTGKLTTLPGIKEKTVQNILEGIDLLARGGGTRHPIAEVEPFAKSILQTLKKVTGLQKIEVAGSLRRKKPTIGDIDIVAVAKQPKVLMNAFVKIPHAEKVLGKGKTKSSLRLANGMQVDLRVVPAESWGAALLYFTGNKNHNIRLRKIAIDHGWKLNEYGLLRESDNKLLAGKTEQEIYKKLGLKYPRPEEREDG